VLAQRATPAGRSGHEFGRAPRARNAAHRRTAPRPHTSRAQRGQPDPDLDGPGLETIVLTRMRKNPSNRYSSMNDVLTDLARVFAGHGDDVVGAPPLYAPDEYRPRSEQARRGLKILDKAGLHTHTVGDAQ
jgi:hypothetical protein